MAPNGGQKNQREKKRELGGKNWGFPKKGNPLGKKPWEIKDNPSPKRKGFWKGPLSVFAKENKPNQREGNKLGGGTPPGLSPRGVGGKIFQNTLSGKENWNLGVKPKRVKHSCGKVGVKPKGVKS